MLLSRIYWEETFPLSGNEKTNNVDWYMYNLMNNINSGIKDRAKEEYKSFVKYYTTLTKTEGEQGDPIDVLKFITKNSSKNLDLLKKLRIEFANNGVDYMIFYNNEFKPLGILLEFSEFILVVYEGKEIHTEIKFGNNNYTLIGAIKHIGGNGSGHYTVALRLNDSWFLYNDSPPSVTPIDNIRDYIDKSRLFLYKLQEPKITSLVASGLQSQTALVQPNPQSLNPPTPAPSQHRSTTVVRKTPKEQLKQKIKESNNNIQKNAQAIIRSSKEVYNDIKYQSFLRYFTKKRDEVILRILSVNSMLSKTTNEELISKINDTLKSLEDEKSQWEGLIILVKLAIQSQVGIMNMLRDDYTKVEFDNLKNIANFDKIFKSHEDDVDEEFLKMYNESRINPDVVKVEETSFLELFNEAIREDPLAPPTQIRESRVNPSRREVSDDTVSVSNSLSSTLRQGVPIADELSENPSDEVDLNETDIDDAINERLLVAIDAYKYLIQASSRLDIFIEDVEEMNVNSDDEKDKQNLLSLLKERLNILTVEYQRWGSIRALLFNALAVDRESKFKYYADALTIWTAGLYSEETLLKIEELETEEDKLVKIFDGYEQIADYKATKNIIYSSDDESQPIDQGEMKERRRQLLDIQRRHKSRRR